MRRPHANRARRDRRVGGIAGERVVDDLVGRGARGPHQMDPAAIVSGFVAHQGGAAEVDPLTAQNGAAVSRFVPFEPARLR